VNFAALDFVVLTLPSNSVGGRWFLGAGGWRLIAT